MRIIRVIELNKTAPSNKSVLWIDTNDENHILAKVYSNGDWSTVEYIDALNYVNQSELEATLLNYITTERFNIELNSLNTQLANKVSITYLNTALSNYVIKEDGKSLSTNDFSNLYKTKLSNIEENAQVNKIESVKANNTELEIVDKSINITIPTNTSDLVNDSGFINSTSGLATSSQLTSEITRATEAETAINDKIPEGTSVSNKLINNTLLTEAVTNSSPDYKGEYTSITDLPTTNVALNDYAFISAVDSNNNSIRKRYKYDGTAWVYEYSSNNITLTSANAGNNIAIDNGIISSTAVSDYPDITNKPSINDVTLSGNKTTEELHIIYGNNSTSTEELPAIVTADRATSDGDGNNISVTYEKVVNKVTSISSASTDTEYPTAKAAYEAKKLLFIDEVSCWGMQYNSETGFFEYHGMTDITYEQALYAYTITSQAGQGRNLDNCFHGIETLRFNFAPLGYDANVWVKSNFGEFAYCVNLEQYNTNTKGYHLVMERMFRGCKKLRKIEMITFVVRNSNTTDAFKECTALEEFDFRLTKNDMNFADSPQIKLPCIVNLINNISTSLTSAITITLETSVYSKAIADNDIINALALQPMAQLASA